MLAEIKKQIAALLPAELGVAAGDLVIPPEKKMGDLSLPCFGLAKKLGKNPMVIAQEIAGQIVLINQFLVQSARATGPYLNFVLQPGAVAKIILPPIIKNKKHLGQNKLGKGAQVILEYPSNNTHKELHIGHFRNICLGNALVNLLSANGFKATPINYLNDFGSHVAKCLWCLRKFHGKENPPANKQKWLGLIYAEASQYIVEHPEAKEEVAVWLQKLETRDKSIWPLFKKTRQWSIDGFAKIFKELGVKHQKTFFEMDVKDAGQKIVNELLKKKIAQVGEGGAIIADLKQYGLDIGLLRKSNGSGLYLTSDLGLAAAKKRAYPKAAVSVHLTGSEQNFYFKQLFKILELAGFQFQMRHVSYGLVSLPQGKMSSRAGNVILYDDLRDEALKHAEAETKRRHPDWPAYKIKKTARAVALAALKFSMLRAGPSQNIVFNLAEAISFDGFTGPYLQYSLARLNSILKKAGSLGNGRVDYAVLTAPTEKALILKLAEMSLATAKASTDYDPSILARYLYETAKLFSEFYEFCPVLKAESAALKKARLHLVAAVKATLESGLLMLGVPLIKEM